MATKSELIQEATALGLEVSEIMTVAQIEAAINAYKAKNKTETVSKQSEIKVVNKTVKALINCTGEGYEKFNAGEIRVLKTEIADLLLKFGYVEEVTAKV